MAKTATAPKALDLPKDFQQWPVEQQFRYLWLIEARPKQLTPEGVWQIWFFKSGRGAGKTRAAAEDVTDFGLTLPDRRIALVGRTLDDVRDTMVEGESGLLATIPSRKIRKWNRSQGDLYLTNGTQFQGFSSQVPDSLRGPQFHRAWGDELAAWIYMRRTYDNLIFGLRLGDNPQCILTSTPKPYPLIKELVARAKAGDGAVLTEGSTYENKQNLSPAFLKELLARYEGTRIGREQLHGEILDDAPGALWTRDLIEEGRWENFRKDLPDMDRIVVGVDPAVTSKETSNETGIVAVGVVYRNCPCGHLPDRPHGFVLEDRTLRATPTEWARVTAEVYDSLEADRVVGEVNNGGELVETVIKSLRPDISYRDVHASRGKKKRAEPVAALSEQKRLHMVGMFPDLEDQMCTFESDPDEDVPDDSDIESPDRMDAMVWAATNAVLGAKKRLLRA